MTIKLNDKLYNQAVEEYLKNGINWDADKNPVIKFSYKSDMNRADLEQFAMDAFFAGAEYILNLCKKQ